MRKVGLIAASLLLSASSLLAQNADIESLSGLNFNFGNPGARALGMGGAFLGLADDASAAEANPAGLTVLRKAEISFEGRSYKSSQTFNVTGEYPDLTSETFGSFSRRVEPSFGSVVIPAGNFAVAAYYHQPINFSNSLAVVSSDTPIFFLGPNGPVTRDQCITLGSQCGGFQLFPFGTAVDIRMQTYGLAGAWKIGALSLGLAGRYQQLDEAAITIRLEELPNGSFRQISQSAQLAEDSDITFSGGFKWAPSERFSLGGVYKQGASFEAPVFFRDVQGGGSFQQTGNPNFNAPDTYGVGISYRPIAQLTINADAVRVNYSNLANDVATVTNQLVASDFAAKDVNEYHVGAEYFFATRIPIAIRGGWWRDPAHALEFVGPLNRANAVAFDILFPGGEDQDHISAGIGLAWPNFQIDAAYDTSDNNKVGSLSFVTRF